MLAVSCTAEMQPPAQTSTTATPAHSTATTNSVTTSSLSSVTTTSQLAEEASTLVIRGGAILTMDPANPVAEAVAVSGNRIVAVGAESEVDSFIGDDTVLIELDGRALLPGFVDAHAHYYGTLLESGIDAVQTEMLSNGVTAVGEAAVWPELLDEILAYESDGRIGVRTSLYLLHDDSCGEDTGRWALDIEPNRDPGRRVHVGGVKVFSDGGSCNAPAVSYEHGFGGHGDLYYTAKDVASIVSMYDEAGFQVAIHALGDRAVETVLDGLDAAIDDANPLRHRIEHNAVIRPEMRDRYDDVGAIPVIFGSFGTCAYLGLDPRFRFSTPVDNQEWEWPWRDLLDLNPNTVFAWHGDYPVFANSTPIASLAGFVTRYQELDDGTVCEPEPYHLKHAITVNEALRLMTVGSAYALHRDDEIGSIEVGKLADVVVLSADPHATPPRELFDLQVELTILDGRPVHCREAFESLCATPSPESAVEASASLPDHPPGHAVDGDLETHWGAGADAPQWIEVPLGEEEAVQSVRFVVDQHPPGPTKHVVWGRLASGELVELGQIEMETEMFDELIIEADDTWSVVAIRVETVTSPSWVSWREIDIVANGDS